MSPIYFQVVWTRNNVCTSKRVNMDYSKMLLVVAFIASGGISPDSQPGTYRKCCTVLAGPLSLVTVLHESDERLHILYYLVYNSYG